MAKQNVAADELNARAEAKGYQRGAHRDKDSLRDRKKHIDKTKQNQDGTLDRYVQ
jgi:hypothetical protein